MAHWTKRLRGKLEAQTMDPLWHRLQDWLPSLLIHHPGSSGHAVAKIKLCIFTLKEKDGLESNKSQDKNPFNKAIDYKKKKKLSLELYMKIGHKNKLGDIWKDCKICHFCSGTFAIWNQQNQISWWIQLVIIYV